ncbi:DUF4113 domain-containing protein [Pseudoalteromonas sp. JC3]|uniref:DUF4113 domain-containing protein n=1 Tax=Pseudoalteromonas sp. JC3 TaxID=2810196 RepID=UPI0024A659D3|nr:DUF4113 domain-containing protein [Pseudoalteromonas sp. JC3]
MLFSISAKNETPAQLVCCQRLLSFTSEQQTKSWVMRRDFLSSRYTKRRPDVPRIIC